MKIRFVLFGVLLLLSSLVACGSPEPDPTPVPPEPTVDVEATVAAAATENYLSFQATAEVEKQQEMDAQATKEAVSMEETAEAQPTEAPEPTPEPTDEPIVELDSADIYSIVSPGLSFVETDEATGSGILLEDGYVMTNAHVVYPSETVRLAFPDGTEFLDVPVVGIDLVADVAIVGPIDIEAEAPAIWDASEAIKVGEDVYLIGYPAESEAFPQATLSRGLMSRTRTWELGDLTYFQTDASIAGGQSGGALVSSKGEVIGLSTFSFGEENFALATSMENIMPRVDALRAGSDVDGLMPRNLYAGEAVTERQGTIDAYWDYDMYIIDADMEETLDLELVSDADMTVKVYDTFSSELYSIDELDTGGTESDSFTLDYTEPLLVVVSQFEQGAAAYTLTSNQPMIYWDDPDERTVSADNGVIKGSIDFPSDYDNYSIEMSEGDTVLVRVESSAIDPYVAIDWVGFDTELSDEFVDDDSGAGPWGLDAEFEFTAPEDGTYFVVVSDASDSDLGGYYLTIESK